MKKYSIVALFALLVISACTQRDNAAQENLAISRAWVEEGWHSGKAGEVVDKFFATNYKGHEGLTEVSGIEGVREQVKGFDGAFSDIQIIFEKEIAVGNKVAARWIIEATHDGEFMGLPATGKKVKWSGIFIARMENGKFAEVWQNGDLHSLLQQLKTETTMK